MAESSLQTVEDKAALQQQIKHIMANIKSLQRDLIRASFKHSSAPGTYTDLLKAINEERALLKQLNQQLNQS